MAVRWKGRTGLQDRAEILVCDLLETICSRCVPRTGIARTMQYARMGIKENEDV